MFVSSSSHVVWFCGLCRHRLCHLCPHCHAPITLAAWRGDKYLCNGTIKSRALQDLNLHPDNPSSVGCTLLRAHHSAHLLPLSPSEVLCYDVSCNAVPRFVVLSLGSAVWSVVLCCAVRCGVVKGERASCVSADSRSIERLADPRDSHYDVLPVARRGLRVALLPTSAQWYPQRPTNFCKLLDICLRGRAHGVSSA